MKRLGATIKTSVCDQKEEYPGEKFAKYLEERHISVGQNYGNNEEEQWGKNAIFVKPYPKCKEHHKDDKGNCDCEDHNHELDDCQHNTDVYNDLNTLCRYCLLARWTKKHKEECMCIPMFALKAHGQE